jgi:hypothetical protein
MASSSASTTIAADTALSPAAESESAPFIFSAAKYLENAARFKVEGNDLLRVDVGRAIAAYRQASACVTASIDEGADASSAAVRALGSTVNSNLAQALLNAGKHEDALVAVDEALRFDARDERGIYEKSLYRRARALGSLGPTRTADARAAARTLLGEFPENKEGAALLAQLGDGPVADAADAAPEGGVAEPERARSLDGSGSATAAKSRKASSSVGARMRLDPAAVRRAMSGMYADTPGYEEPLPDIRPEEDRASWWDWVCCCCCPRRAAKKPKRA